MDATDLLIWSDYCEMERGLPAAAVRAVTAPAAPFSASCALNLRNGDGYGYGDGYGDGYGYGSGDGSGSGSGDGSGDEAT